MAGPDPAISAVPLRIHLGESRLRRRLDGRVSSTAMTMRAHEVIVTTHIALLRKDLSSDFAVGAAEAARSKLRLAG